MTKDVLEVKIDKLTRTVGKGFRAVDKRFFSMEQRMEKGFAAVAEDISELKNNVSVLQVRVQENTDGIARISHELVGARRKLDAIHETIDSMKGYATEIDDLNSRVSAVEKRSKVSSK